MIFNKHSDLLGRHAFLSASKYHWTNYDEEKIERTYMAALAVQRGNELHAFAHDAIRLGIKLPRNSTTLNMYINDAIGYRMTPELVLFYSQNCFGTADAIGFKKGLLRIHDLKTGVSPTSERQLEVYAALFCLEYKMTPFEIGIELRIYQANEARIYEPDPDDLMHLMDKIIVFDRRIEEIKKEVNS